MAKGEYLKQLDIEYKTGSRTIIFKPKPGSCAHMSWYKGSGNGTLSELRTEVCRECPLSEVCGQPKKHVFFWV